MPSRVRTTIFLAATVLLLSLPLLADRTAIRPGWNLFSPQQDIETWTTAKSLRAAGPDANVHADFFDAWLCDPANAEKVADLQPVAADMVMASGSGLDPHITVRNALFNGLFWTGVKGYRSSYVTAYNNEIYGIYAFDSVDGLFEHSYASGSYDAGFYIGQCDPCDAVIDGVLAENNGLGYSGTNAGGNLRIVRSVWRDNVAGIVPKAAISP